VPREAQPITCAEHQFNSGGAGLRQAEVAFTRGEERLGGPREAHHHWRAAGAHGCRALHRLVVRGLVATCQSGA
jgi:hypothetical protein